jgi:hypothetical protein
MYSLKPYNDFKSTSNWNTFYFFKNVFNDEIIVLGEETSLTELKF